MKVNSTSRLNTTVEGELKRKMNSGYLDTLFKPAITNMELVPKRNKDTLLPIIQRIVKQGSMVYSDQWRAYNKIQDELNLEHSVVNHSLNVVDPETGVHTQTIESYWAKAKYKLKEMKDVSSDALSSYLDERMWRDRWARTGEDAFMNIIVQIAEQYKV